MPEQQRYRMAGEDLGLTPDDVASLPASESPEGKPNPRPKPDQQVAGVCPIPGLPANHCCRQYHKCRLLPPGAKQPLPGLGVGLA
jgi:hypothetical protein